jgi:hypothetical protein
MASTTTGGSTTPTSGGTATSFSNTPQAVDDTFRYVEDGTQTILVLDVMANDLGGNAKQLYALDNGISAGTATKTYAPADLLVRDTAVTDAAALGTVQWTGDTS